MAEGGKEAIHSFGSKRIRTDLIFLASNLASFLFLFPFFSTSSLFLATSLVHDLD